MLGEEEQILVDPRIEYLHTDGSELFLAASRGDVEEVRRLIRIGHTVDSGCPIDCLTPLHGACSSGHPACADLLLQHHADVEARNIDGSTPLCEAALSGSMECVQLLLARGAQVNPPLSTTSPLHEATLRGHVAVMGILIAEGASLTCNDLHYGTPLHVAAQKQHLQAAKLLLLAGAPVSAIKTHQMALHIAAANHDHQMAALLLEFGANAHARNTWGKRALDLVPTNLPLQYDASQSVDFLQLLQLHESCPYRLMHQCRLVVRRSLYHPTLVSCLGLPTFLQQYLTHSISTGRILHS